MIRLTFLGTSAGLPTTARNVSGLAVEWIQKPEQKSGDWLLVDCGEGTQHQIAKTNLALGRLKAILITHLHGDHCFGLAGLLSTLAMQGRVAPLALMAPKGLMKILDTLSLVSELYFSYPIEFIDIESQHTDTLIHLTQGLSAMIGTVKLSHRIPSYAFVIRFSYSIKKLDVVRLANEDKTIEDWQTILNKDPSYLSEQMLEEKIVVAGDNDTPALLTQAVQGAKALIHECTYTQAVQDKILSNSDFDPKHTSAQSIGKFAQSVNLTTLILTHFSARYALFNAPADPRLNMGHIQKEVLANYQGRLILAEDFLQVLV